MKIKSVKLHNFRSFLDDSFELEDYSLLVGANNAGKSNIIRALLVFYEKENLSANDFPKLDTKDDESWIEICFKLTEEEWKNIKDDYKNDDKLLNIRKYLKSIDKERCKSNQSNLYAVINGNVEKNLFYGAKNIGQAKIGDVIHIPSINIPNENLKMSGPSPFREIVSFVINRFVKNSIAYNELNTAIEALNEEAKKENGFISEIEKPINKAIEEWDILIKLNIQEISTNNIIRQLFQHQFQDTVLGNTILPLEQFGQGFQRSFIYEILRIASSYQSIPVQQKKEFRTDFVIILFEEPEAFLHPHQQETMSYNLKKIGLSDNQQVLITTHSPIFVGKSSDDLKQIIRVHKTNGISETYQVSKERLDDIFRGNLDLLKCIQEYVNDPNIPDGSKKNARKLLENPPTEEISKQEESFRFQLWLNSERSSMFFVDNAVLVEGFSDKVFFDYMLENDWRDLRKHHIYIVDTFGKFNTHKFMFLLQSFGIKHGVIIDGDEGKEHHTAINDFVLSCKNSFTNDSPYILQKDIETFLGLQSPKDRRKPLEMLKALSNNTIERSRINEFREIFERHILGIKKVS